MLILETAKPALSLDKNFCSALPAESKGAVVGISQDPLSGEPGSFASPARPGIASGYTDAGFENWQKDRLSTVQVRGVGAAAPPPSGASHLSAPSCAERLGGISPQPMQADVGRSEYQQKTDRYPALAYFNFSGGKPGNGTKTSECEKWLYTGKDENGNVKIIKHSCGRITCPVDYPDYLIKKAGEIDDRFKGYVRDVLEVKKESRQIIFSMSPERVLYLRESMSNNDPAIFLDLYRAEYNEMLKASGLSGGISFYHDCRVMHPGTGATGARGKMLIGRDAKTSGFMEADAPKSKIYAWIAKQPNRKDYYYFSPHTHAIVFGRILDIDSFRKACPNWIYKNKGPVKNVAGLVYYLMSHMAVISDKRSVTGFGCMSSALLGRDLISEKLEDELSPDGLPYFIVEAVDPMMIGKKITRIVKIWLYRKIVHGEQNKDPAVVFDRQLKKGMRDLVSLSRIPDPNQDKFVEGIVTRYREYKESLRQTPLFDDEPEDRSLSIWGPAGPPVPS